MMIAYVICTGKWPISYLDGSADVSNRNFGMGQFGAFVVQTIKT